MEKEASRTGDVQRLLARSRLSAVVAVQRSVNGVQDGVVAGIRAPGRYLPSRLEEGLPSGDQTHGSDLAL